MDSELVELETYWNQLVSNGDQMRCVRGGASRKKMQIFAAKVRSQLRIDVLKMWQTRSGRKGLGERRKGVLHSELPASLFTARVCCYLLRG